MTSERDGSTQIGAAGFEPRDNDSASGEAELAPRVRRLQTLVKGLGIVLERLESGGEPLDGMAFEDFDDPGASNEALDLVFESFSDARRDLAVLRHAAPLLAGATFASPARTVLVGLGELSRSAGSLAEAYERYRRSIDQRVPPRTPGGSARLDEFLGMIVRALRDVAAVVQAAPALPPLAVVLATPPAVTPTAVAAASAPAVAPSAAVRADPVVLPAASLPAAQRAPAQAKPATPPVGAWLCQHVQRRRTRLLVESGALLLVVLVIVASAMLRGGPPTGATGVLDPSNGTPGSSIGGPVAVGGGSSPQASPSPGASPLAGQTAAPGTPGATTAPPASTPPRATPRPTSPPGPTPQPTPDPAIAAGKFADRISAATGEIDGLLAAISSAVQDADFQHASAAASNIATISSTERSWLLSNPPASCFASSYDTAVTRYGDVIATATSIEQAAEAADANTIHQEVGSTHGDLSALKQAATKAVTACA
ncbi:MAG TPA: hypothetical protein VL749_00560 [Patescibacteria group bacterium]|nr:hypothetical protein [Patescibacteria group bacterium]